MAVSVNYHPRGEIMQNLTVRATVAIDRGSLYGNNWGVLLGISYRGSKFYIK